MQTEMTNMLHSTIGRMLQDKHPVSLAREVRTSDDPVLSDVWTELVQGGWLDTGCEEFQLDNRAQTLLLGELSGRSLLSLPFGFSAFVLAPIVQATVDQGTESVILPLETYPASGRVGRSADSQDFVDYFGEKAAYYQLSSVAGSSDKWLLQRFSGADLSVVAGIEACVPVANLSGVTPVAQCEFQLPAEKVRCILFTYLAFELGHILGAATATLDAAIAYAKERHQFGKAIGQFQGIKHALVNAWVAVDNGRYAVRSLLEAIETGDLDTQQAVAGTANRLVIAAAKQASKLSIQVHGGIGFSWEHDAHLFLKRVYKSSIRSSAVQRFLDALCTACICQFPDIFLEQGAASDYRRRG